MATKFFATSKVTVRGQICIPKAVQKKLGGINEGDYILFTEDNGRIYVEKGVLVTAGK
ncbi:MAG: AbrB/MazE/SpoVT family DNA-binding domain-containing protein [Candidatus Nanoarchaeia archaeon]|nr:AbrB/MazE/SpoVT family DNA-binding domain-containing protein [Candidatus Nanoarchaeia archaeon]